MTLPKGRRPSSVRIQHLFRRGLLADHGLGPLQAAARPWISKVRRYALPRQLTSLPAQSGVIPRRLRW
jgi:hypothetical protein